MTSLEYRFEYCFFGAVSFGIATLELATRSTYSSSAVRLDLSLRILSARSTISVKKCLGFRPANVIATTLLRVFLLQGRQKRYLLVSI